MVNVGSNLPHPLILQGFGGVAPKVCLQQSTYMTFCNNLHFASAKNKNKKKESQKKCQKKKKEKTKRKSKRDWTGGFVGAVFGKPDGYAFACLVLPAVRR